MHSFSPWTILLLSLCLLLIPALPTAVTVHTPPACGFCQRTRARARRTCPVPCKLVRCRRHRAWRCRPTSCPTLCHSSRRRVARTCRRYGPLCAVVRCASSRSWTCARISLPVPVPSTSSPSPSVAGVLPSPPPLPSGVLPSPSSSPSNAPSRAPGASAFPSPPPTFVGTFHVPGGLNNWNNLRLADPFSSSHQFNVNYNVTVNKAGIVALGSRPDLITSVFCSRTGSVRVVLPLDIPPSSLREMYPPGAILVVAREHFGPCVLGDLPTRPGDSAARRVVSNSDKFADGYLRIRSVVGSPQDAIISGDPVTFFEMFDSGSVLIQRRRIPIARQATDVVSANEGSSDLMANVERQSDSEEPRVRSIVAEEDYRAVSLTVTGTFTDRGSIEVVEAKWGGFFGTPIVKVKFISSWDVSLNIEAEWKGTGNPKRTEEPIKIGNFLLYGVPKLNFLQGSDIAFILIPKLDVGVFFELPLLLTFDVSVSQDLFSTSKLSYVSKTTEILASFSRSEGFSVVPTSTGTSSSSRDLVPTVNRASGTPLQFNLDAFLGFQPALALYLPLFEVRLSIDAGLAISSSLRLFGAPPFLPIESPNPAPLVAGSCDTCHFLQIDANALLGNLQVLAEFSVEIPEFFFVEGLNYTLTRVIPLTSEPFFDKPLFKGCYFPQHTLNPPACGNTCCDLAALEVCQTPDPVSSPVCGPLVASPSPSSTTSRTPSPTPSPSVQSTDVTPGDPLILDGLPVDGEKSFNVDFAAREGGTPKEDLYLLSDATNSMRSAISAARSKFQDVVNKRKAASDDVAFGVGLYRDEAEPGLDSGFQNIQSVTTDVNDALAGINRLSASSTSANRDNEEAGLVALYKVATQNIIGWRTGARRILVWFGDYPGHEPSCVDGIEITRAGTISALKNKGITVVAASFGFRGLDASTRAFGCPSGTDAGGTGQGSAITSATGGTLVASSDQTELVAEIEKLVGGLSLEYNVDTTPCDGKVQISYVPPLPFSLAPGETKTVRQTIKIGQGVCDSGASFECQLKYTASGGDLPPTTVKVANVRGCE